MDLKMYHDAIEELLDAQDARAKFLEKTCGFMYADDLREYNQKEICKLLETNEPYARVPIDLEHLWYKDENLYSLTEIARRKNSKNPSYTIQAWLRDVKTLELLCLWEKEHNRLFEEEEANKLIAKTKEPSFTITAKVWIEKTSAQGIVSKQGKGGGTFAHHEIAIDFITWLFPEKRYGIYNNLKGKIVEIQDSDENIVFKIELSDRIDFSGRLSNEIDIVNEDSKSYAIVEKMKYYNDKYDSDMDTRTKLPFQISYAMSIHKAQGLEFDSVKIVITKESDEQISRNVLYTAITRAKQKLKVYWEPEVANEVLGNIEKNSHSKTADLSILKQEFSDQI